MTYQLRAESVDGFDLHETNCPMEAVTWLQDSREWATEITYTGDPYADFAALAEA